MFRIVIACIFTIKVVVVILLKHLLLWCEAFVHVAVAVACCQSLLIVSDHLINNFIFLIMYYFRLDLEILHLFSNMRICIHCHVL